MECTNCAKAVGRQTSYYLGGFNKNIFCSRACIKNMYDGIFDESEVQKTILKKDNMEEN